jgi:hypothetical protein
MQTSWAEHTHSMTPQDVTTAFSRTVRDDKPRLGILRVVDVPGLVEEARQAMPAGHAVVAERVAPGCGYVELLVEGPDMPADWIQDVQLIFTKTETGLSARWLHRP